MYNIKQPAFKAPFLLSAKSSLYTNGLYFSSGVIIDKYYLQSKEYYNINKRERESP